MILINNELIRHLAAKAKEGVEVRAVFDGFGNASNNRPMKKHNIEAIRKQGIEIYEFNQWNFHGCKTSLTETTAR